MWVFNEKSYMGVDVFSINKIEFINTSILSFIFFQFH